MARKIYNLKPVSHITADAIGPPGKRIFYLQASQDETLVTLVLEKEQVRALAVSIGQALTELEKQNPQPLSDLELLNDHDMGLRQPVHPDFRVGQIALGYDQENDLLIIIAQELTDESEEMSVARFWCTRAQIKALSEHSLRIIEAGRPDCPLCNQPIDPDGHFCPRRNGHM